MQADTDTNKIVYRSIGKLHDKLSEEQRNVLVNELKTLIAQYEAAALVNPLARKVIYRIFEERKASGKIVATMSRAFSKKNPAATGALNSQITQAIYTAFDADYRGHGCGAAAALAEIRLDPNILNDPRLAALDPATYDRITEIRDRLFHSVIKMCATIAKRMYASISSDSFGEVIEEADLHQEAVLLAKQSVDTWDPADGRAFSVYMYYCVAGLLSNYVKMRYRAVVIPRRKINRLGPMNKALSRVADGASYDEIAEEATSILREQVAENRSRKLRSKEHYTADEVENLLKIDQAEVSLDVSVTSDDGVVTTMGQQIASNEPSPDSVVEKYRAFGSILSVVRSYCSAEEYEFMRARWTSEGPVSLKVAATNYRKRTGKAMHKAQASEIEARVFTRIREGIEKGDGRLTEIQSALDSLS